MEHGLSSGDDIAFRAVAFAPDLTAVAFGSPIIGPSSTTSRPGPDRSCWRIPLSRRLTIPSGRTTTRGHGAPPPRYTEARPRLQVAFGGVFPKAASLSSATQLPADVPADRLDRRLRGGIYNYGRRADGQRQHPVRQLRHQRRRRYLQQQRRRGTVTVRQQRL